MVDVEKGISPGVYTTAPHFPSLISPTYLEHGQLDQSPSQEGSHFGDSSGPLFHMYSKITEKDDNTMAERWQKDADGILIFVGHPFTSYAIACINNLQAGLFSGTVATFLSLSIPELRQNSQDVSAFYLKNIYQHLADPNVSVPPTPPFVETPPAFSPPHYAVTVNLLWVLCICINLTCAILATMFQQWARQYVRFSQSPRRSPRRRARIRALFASNVDKVFIRTLSFLLPCYLHFSVLLFFVGLLVYLLNINDTLFTHMLWFFVGCMVVYTFLTFLPLFQTDSLLFTPISAFPASFVALLTCLVHSTFADRFKFKTWSVSEWLFEDVRGPVENISLKQSSEIDARILQSTLNSLNEDDALEKFFGSIPDFFSSKWVKLFPTNLPTGLRDVFKEALYEFLDDTFRSTTIPESVKSSRLIIGLDASHTILGPNGPSWILDEILDGSWPELLRLVEIGHSLRSWAHGNDEENALLVRSIISYIVSNVENRNDRWLMLAEDQLGMPEELLRHYLDHGDSVLLANLINITRLTFCSHPLNWEFYTLPFKCDVSSTLPGLQHDFCALWNEIVLEAQTGKDSIHTLILENIRPVYIALHSDTHAFPKAFSTTATDNDIPDRPSSYPLCNIASHRSDPSAHDHNEAVDDDSPAIHLRIHSIPHHSPGPVFISSSRAFEIPTHHTARDPADKSSGTVSDAPQPYPSMVPSSLLDISVASFIANLDRRPISSNAIASQQSEFVISPAIVYDSPSILDPPYTDYGS